MKTAITALGRTLTTPDQRKALRRQFEREVLARAYAGKRFTCPICTWSFRALLPGGYHGRANARCPRCGSYERHRTLALFLRDFVPTLEQSPSVLHVAPEPSLRLLLSRKLSVAKYKTLDLFMNAVDYHCSVTEIPIEDGSFDLVICSHVLQEVDDHSTAITELTRVLAPGGTLLLQLPYRLEGTLIDRNRMSAEDFAKHFGPKPPPMPFLKLFGHELFDELDAAGLEVSIYDPQEKLPETTRESLRLRESVLVCQKRPVRG